MEHPNMHQLDFGFEMEPTTEPKTFKNAGQMDAMMEIAPKHLSDYEQILLKRIRVWIYDKRRKALKQKLKEDKPAVKEKANQKKLSL